ncbi:MAG TPA: NTF2 fold immunity protein [Pirellulales bacterium]|nr:NTF2 fold immunity protein [Pirellulales bacterium]
MWKRTAALVGCLAIAAATTANLPAAAKPDRKVDLELDEKSAVQIAEIILAKVYGQKVLQEKPWQISSDKTAFTIEGTFHGQGFGGVARIRISRATAEVLEVIHGK